MRGSGRSIPLKSMPMFLSAKVEFSLLNMESSFLTSAMMGASLLHQLDLRDWLTFLQAQLPVQRQTKHLRAAYFSFLNLAQTSSCSRMSATSLKRQERTLVVASSFPWMELFTISMQESYSLRSVVANCSSSLLRIFFLSLALDIITPSIWFLKQWMCGSQLIASMRSPLVSRGSWGQPVGSGMVLTFTTEAEEQHWCAPIIIYYRIIPDQLWRRTIKQLKAVTLNYKYLTRSN